MVKQTDVREWNELTATVENCRSSYSLVDHRPQVDRLDDEAIIELSTTIDRISGSRKDLLRQSMAVTLYSSASYYPKNDGGAPLVPRSTLSLRKGACSTLIHLPTEAFWGLHSRLLDSHLSLLTLTYGRAQYGSADLISIAFHQPKAT